MKTYLKSYMHHLLNLLIGYVGGIIIGNIICIFILGPFVIFAIPISFVLGIPIFVLFSCLILILKNNIEKYLKIWCFSAPFLSLLTLLQIQYAIRASRYTEKGFLEYTYSHFLWELPVILFVCAIIGVVIYYMLTKKYLEKRNKAVTNIKTSIL